MSHRSFNHFKRARCATEDAVGWITVARDCAVVDRIDGRLIAAARAAMPAGLPDDGTILLPLEPTTDRCRLCGETRPLTKEHIPPAAAFNRARATERDPWDREARGNDELPEGRTQSEGIWGYTLCADCNSRTGSWYGTEYQQWAIAAVNSMAGAGLNVKTLDAQRGPLLGRFGLGGDPGPRPGAFVRQALSMMASAPPVREARPRSDARKEQAKEFRRASHESGEAGRVGDRERSKKLAADARYREMMRTAPTFTIRQLREIGDMLSGGRFETG
jgi:hypothetical protein